MSTIYTPDGERAFIQKAVAQMAVLYVDSIVDKVWPFAHKATSLTVVNSAVAAQVQLRVLLDREEEELVLELLSPEIPIALDAGLRDLLPQIEQAVVLSLPGLARGLLALKSDQTPSPIVVPE
jgi:hypothetical protein